ncbi:MAG TPA: type II toxin-antitoxin system RelE/ParE family toxin [Xanthobacteraceae bacterium]|jgi:plasmid stabilization system protein ParE|nr:type II toxin-antitoxin system RelE/ParE family toxin [Xanthobacteraceae bacterium]
MTHLVVTPQADADASTILAYLNSQAGSRVAETFARRFRETLTRLLQFPETGAPCPVFGPQARIAIVQPYLMIYDFIRADDTVTLLRILHGRRHITHRLLGR